MGGFVHCAMAGRDHFKRGALGRANDRLQYSRRQIGGASTDAGWVCMWTRWGVRWTEQS